MTPAGFQSYGTVNIGLMNYIVYAFSLAQEVLKYLFDLTSGNLSWTTSADGQIMLNGSLPTLTTKGGDIVASIMTIVHNGLAFLAEFSTLLPSNALTG